MSQNSNSALVKKLINTGFENIRVINDDSFLYVSLEDNLYRWNVKGVLAAINQILENTTESNLVIVILNKDIPQYQISISENDSEERKIELTYNLKDAWEKLKKIEPQNRNFFKTDIILTPQLKLKNSYFDKIYHIQFNIAPEFQTSLWNGMLASAQLIVPIKNEFEIEQNFIRPGIVLLSQEFKINQNYFSQLTIGNFTNQRYGVDLKIIHPIADSNWSILLNSGYTGNSNFQNGYWTKTKIDRFSGYGFLQYFYPKYDLQTEIGYVKFWDGRSHCRINVTRSFHEKHIGFYLCYGEDPVNGGFYFSLPLAFSKRERKHSLRVVPAKFFDFDYNTSSDSDSFPEYFTSSQEKRDRNRTNLTYLKKQITQHLKP